jgi:hypothetical protein
MMYHSGERLTTRMLTALCGICLNRKYAKPSNCEQISLVQNKQGSRKVKTTAAGCRAYSGIAPGSIVTLVEKQQSQAMKRYCFSLSCTSSPSPRPLHLSLLVSRRRCCSLPSLHHYPSRLRPQNQHSFPCLAPASLSPSPTPQQPYP